MKTVKALNTFLVLTLSGLSAHAAAVELKAGKWGFTSVSTGMMSTEGVEEYNEQCMTEPFNPMGEMMDNEMASLCEVQVNEESAEFYDADLVCDVPNAGTMSGNFSVKITDGGNGAEGSVNMSMTFGGQTMTLVSATYQAEYLGACD